MVLKYKGQKNCHTDQTSDLSSHHPAFDRGQFLMLVWKVQQTHIMDYYGITMKLREILS